LPQEATKQGRSRSHDHSTDSLALHVVNAEKRQVLVKFGKKLTIADVEKYVAMLIASPDFRPDFSEIVDLTGVEDLNLTADDFLKLADQVDPFSPQAKRAFVVRSSVQGHAARMHKILRTQQTVEIFRSVEEAELWIQS
jgi:hypothetical protein